MYYICISPGIKFQCDKTLHLSYAKGQGSFYPPSDNQYPMVEHSIPDGMATEFTHFLNITLVHISVTFQSFTL